MRRILLVVAVAVLSACAKLSERGWPAVTPGEWRKTPGLYAVLETGKGRVVCRLFEEKAPRTVSNFAGLAAGTKEFLDPRDGRRKKARFYDGLAFMRVVPGFMIQGGDPLGNTAGGPGYEFADEFHPELQFDRPGLVAMANSGPDTNGSQFFITDRPRAGYRRLPTHLSGRHTIFGEVVEGHEAVSAIADVPAREEMALEPVRMDRVEIVRIGPDGRETRL